MVSLVIESNVVRRTCGGIVLSTAANFRKSIMLNAAGVNVFGCILCIFALFGMGSSYSAVVFGRWIYGEVEVASELPPSKVYDGVSSRVLAIDCDEDDMPDETRDSLLAFGFFDDGDGVWAMEQSDDTCNEWTSSAIRAVCENCKDNQYSVSMRIMGVVTYWSSILTNFRRSTEIGDACCQKFMGMIGTIIGILTSIMALTGYANVCYSRWTLAIQADQSSFQFYPSGCAQCDRHWWQYPSRRRLKRGANPNDSDEAK